MPLACTGADRRRNRVCGNGDGRDSQRSGMEGGDIAEPQQALRTVLDSLDRRERTLYMQKTSHARRRGQISG